MNKVNIDQARFIEVSARIRYWEDTYLNNKEDTDGNIPLRNDHCWEPVIDLQSGKIQDWPEGITAEINYKVCDEGEYWLLDENKQCIAKWKGSYVPNDILCVGDEGFGDYIIFDVAADGIIIDWIMPKLNTDQWDCIKSDSNMEKAQA